MKSRHTIIRVSALSNAVKPDSKSPFVYDNQQKREPFARYWVFDGAGRVEAMLGLPGVVCGVLWACLFFFGKGETNLASVLGVLGLLLLTGWYFVHSWVRDSTARD